MIQRWYPFLKINLNFKTNATIKSNLNNKIYYTDENGYFNFGFPEGIHEFTINNEEIITITFHPHETLFSNFYIGDELLQGDINNDLIIDVLDVIISVNYIIDLMNEPELSTLWAADMNYDRIISILDVVRLVNFIL